MEDAGGPILPHPGGPLSDMQPTLLYQGCQGTEGSVLITPAKALGLLSQAEHSGMSVLCEFSDQVWVREGAPAWRIYRLNECELVHSLGTEAMKFLSLSL